MWYRIALSCIGDAVLVTDRDGRVAFVNPAAQAILGLENECKEMDASVFMRLMNSSTHASIEYPFAVVLRDDIAAQDWESCLLRRDDETQTPIAIQGTQLRDVDGAGDGFVYVFREDVIHQQLSANLTDSEKRYRRLFESAKDGILILDADSGIVMDVNPFLTQLLGYSHEDFAGKLFGNSDFSKTSLLPRRDSGRCRNVSISATRICRLKRMMADASTWSLSAMSTRWITHK